VFGYDPEEEYPRPEYLAKLSNVKERTINFITQTTEPKPPFWKMKLPGILISWSIVMFFITLSLITVVAIIIYRMSMVVAHASVPDVNIKNNWSLFISMTGASINLFIILLLNFVYKSIAKWLTEKELHRTQTGFDDALTLKIYLFQFFNHYSSIIYIGFIKGKFVGTPNNYTRFLNLRQEECAPGGCFVELSVELAIIFMGKQFVLSIMEYCMPLIWRALNLLMGWSLKKDSEERTPQYVKDFQLSEWSHQALFYEYLERVIQYGFIALFVCAFPLAPFFALLNNILELRLDAKKVIVEHRRPTAQKVQNIGVWLDIMETLGRISIITNAFIIALTSEFIPKLVYRYVYSSDGSLNGYIDFSLSYFNTKDLDPDSMVHRKISADDPEVCRYPDYKTSPNDDNPYQHNAKFWHIWCARLLFVIIFLIVVFITDMVLRLAIPDVPSTLQNEIRREDFITKEIIISTERERLKKLGKLKPQLSESNPKLRGPGHLNLHRWQSPWRIKSSTLGEKQQ